MLSSSPQRCGGSCTETAGGTGSSHYPSSRSVPRMPAGLYHTHNVLHIQQSRMNGYTVQCYISLLFPVAAALVHLIGQENHEWGVWMLFMALQSHQLNKQVRTHAPQVPCTHWSCVVEGEGDPFGHHGGLGEGGVTVIPLALPTSTPLLPLSPSSSHLSLLSPSPHSWCTTSWI